MQRGQVVANREEPSLASRGTFSGRDEVLAGGVREFSTDSCHAVWVLM